MVGGRHGSLTHQYCNAGSLGSKQPSLADSCGWLTLSSLVGKFARASRMTRKHSTVVVFQQEEAT